MSYRLLAKVVSFWEVFASRRLICCVLTILYNEDEGLSNIHDQGQSPRTCIFDDPNPNCITGLYQNVEVFPFPIGSSELSNVITQPKWQSRETLPYRL